ncbi:TPA: hypothetical protein ACFP3Z_000800, partial [Neisseria subflava]|uniref:hypothetical protein n=1 Tax=Neisseria sp. 27098_8_112 TaxID=3003682 RepID=UPI00352F0CA3
HGLCGLLEEGAHEKSPKCLGGNLGDFGEFCKGLSLSDGLVARFAIMCAINFLERTNHDGKLSRNAEGFGQTGEKGSRGAGSGSKG